jgi:hypothetical protein
MGVPSQRHEAHILKKQRRADIALKRTHENINGNIGLSRQKMYPFGFSCDLALNKKVAG